MIKSEHIMELNTDNVINMGNNTLTEYKYITKDEQIIDIDQTSANSVIDKETDSDCMNKPKEIGYGKMYKKEPYRTRRLTMFKRVTSMENLKNHKERQRLYIKKNLNIKRDGTDNEYQGQNKNISVKADKTPEFETQYKCSKCDRCYSSKKSLDRHESTHNNKEFKCEDCGKQFLYLEKLLKHLNLHKIKEKPKPVLCRICNKNFRKTDTMVRHLNIHKRVNPKEVFSILKEIRDKRKSENGPELSEIIHITMDKGNKTTKNEKLQNVNNGMIKELRKRNIRIEQNDSSLDLLSIDSSNDESESFDNTLLFHCKHCSKCYSTERSLQRHLLIHDEKKFVCNVCNMKFFRQDRLKSHMDRYGHDETKICSEPQKPPDDESAIKLINSWIREELDSDNEGKGFPCIICGKSYDTKKSLLKHEVNTHGKQDKYCINCGSICICPNKHKHQEKGNEKVKPYTCEKCNKSFEKEIKLQRHIRIHERTKEQQDTNFKRFLCHICSKTFRQNTGLMFHMRTHTGYKPHVCKYCGRGFTSNSNCINHERTHTGDRPFVCHFCSAAFAKSCTLKAHITTHTGEANYHCKTCGKSFRRLKYLKEHKFTHTGEKPYACKICGTAYSHSGSLFVHEKKCKAQYNNYQSTTVQEAHSYSQSQAAISMSPAVITPIITTLPQAHLNIINSTLNVPTNKNYIDNIQRMNSHTTGAAATVVSSSLHAHTNTDISEMSSTVRNFAIIGQMFHS